MDFSLQGGTYEYSLSLVAIKMEVNFPCKMKVQHNTSTLTTEVSSNGSHKFIFNQEISIRQSLHRQYFQLQICLLTDKGAKYTAGVVKLFHNQLARSQGQRIVLPLGRCLDKQATFEIVVDKISKSIVSGKRQTFGRQSKNAHMPMFDTIDIENIQQQQNKFKQPKQNYNVAAQTKSQFHFPIYTARNNVNVEWDQKSRQVPQSYYQKNPSKSPNTRTIANRSRVPKSIHQQQQRISNDFQDDIQSYGRDKLIQAQVYKQQYVKLKQKYRKEAQAAKNELNKRIELQNSQNTLKLEVMKYKLKADEYERASNDKSAKIKDLQTQLNALQQRQLQMQYLKNDLQQKDHQLRIMQDTLRQLSHQNDELKAINQNKYNHEIQKIGQLKHQLENNKNKYESRIVELEKELKTTQVEWNSMEKEIIRLNSILDQEKNTNIQLENTLANKTYQFQRILQSEKSSSQQSLDEMYNKLQRIQRELVQKQQLQRELYKQNQKIKTSLMKLQYDKKLLLQDNDSLKSQYQDIKLYKQKYTLLFRQQKFILQQKKQLQKQLEKTITTKDSNIQQMNLQYNDQIEYYKRMNKETDQRAKNYSNKIIQLEGQIDIVKGQAEKVRRSNENLIKELAQSKEKQKQSKKALKTKQQQVLSLQTQYSTIKQKSKNIDQLFKLQTDKLKDQIQKFKCELQNEYMKTAQLADANNELGVELGKVRVKLQFTEERLEKESLSLRDRQGQLENLVKDYEMQISSLEDTINYLRQNEKQLSANLSRTQSESLKFQQLSDKLQKKIKLLQQKLLNTENNLQAKQQQISNLLYDREQMMKKINQLDGDINELKSQGSMLNSEKNKGLKVIQIYEDDMKKAKHDIGVFTLSLAEKQRQFETVKNQLKNIKDELMRSELKHSGLKKQTDRFRDSLTQSLNNSFIPILTSLNLFSTSQQPSQQQQQSRNFSWLNGVQIQRNRKTITQTTSWTQIVSTIISHSKDLKLLINRLFQQVKTLQKQLQKMAQQQNMSTSKQQSTEFQFQRTINQLQNQLSSLLAIKQQQAIKYDHMIQQLNNTLKQKQHEIADLHQSLEDVHFTLNSINQEFQQTSDGHSKKLTQFKKQKLEVQEKYEELCQKQMDMEDNLQRNKMQMEQLATQLQASKSNQHHLAQQIVKLNATIQSNELQFDQLKRVKKALLQKVSQLQLQLSRETQLKNKTQLLLTDEEKKNHQLKEFTNNLMKQKETGIKADIVKTQQIINLETANIQLERDNEILGQQNQRLKKSLQDTRQQVRTLSLKIKVLQDEMTDLVNEKLKVNQKVKQKDRQLQQSLQQIKKLQSKHQKLIQRINNDKHNLQQQLQQKNQQLKQKISQYSEKIISLEKIIHQKTSKIISCENTINQLEQQHWQKRDSIEKLQQQVKDKQILIQQQKARVQQQLMINQQLLAEVKQKQQNMFDLSGKLYNMEMLLSSRQTEHNNRLQQLQLEWTDKQQSLTNQYQQRLQLIQKQRDYFKNIIDQKQQQITAIKSESKNTNIEQSSMKKTLQDKIKKLEQDRLQLFTLKTQEIQKLTDQIKRLSDAIRTKESENRRLANEIDVVRGAIAKMEEKSKEVEQKLKNVNNLYANELQQLKKKEQSYKTYKQWIVNQQWAMQREIKKLAAAFIKRFLENIIDEKNSTKMVEIVKNFETTLIETVSNKLEQQ